MPRSVTVETRAAVPPATPDHLRKVRRELFPNGVVAVSWVVDIWGLHRLRIRCLETYRTPVG
jgi:hypothetical protein